MCDFIPWKIIHINLADEIPDLSAEPGFQALYVVFWWHDTPMGRQLISATQLPMRITELVNLAAQTIEPAVRAQLFSQESLESILGLDNQSQATNENSNLLPIITNPLKKLEERWSNLAPRVPNETVSVVICTRDRSEQLAECLCSLQNLSPAPYEVIVVDNAPITDQTYQLVSKMSGIRYIEEPRPGLSVARNTGIRHSSGDIIAFTDDDVIVYPNWIAQLQQSFQHEKVMAVTGLVIPAELETEAQVAFETELGSLGREYQAITYDQLFFDTNQSIGVPVWRIGAGANMAFRRLAFELVGYFDEQLGAGASGCSEDSEMWYRLLADGWRCCYEPAAVVFHHHRRDLKGLKKQMYYYMRGHVVALFVQFERYKHWGNLFRIFLLLPKYYVGLLVFGLLRGFGSRYKTYISEVLGCIAGVKFYLQNQFIKG
jgi:glycosyltransferase involved in cell wall biosynthesis